MAAERSQTLISPEMFTRSHREIIKLDASFWDQM